MAAPIIKIKRSSVPGKIPTTASLPVGEFGINTYDGKVYIQQDQGGVGVGSTVIVVNPWSVGLGSNTYNTFFTVGNVGIGITNPTETLTVVGIVSATSFIGDGSGLTGVISSGNGIPIQENGIPVGTAVTMNFGSNLNVSFVSGVATITTNSTSQFVTTAAGIHTLSNVGIGTTNPTSALTVTGDGSFTGVVTATTFVGALTGTATSTTNIPNLTGDITSANTVTTLATVNSNVGTFGSGGAIPTITVNAKGLITGVTTTAVNPANDGTLTLAVSGTGLSGSASFTANQSGSSSFTVTSNATNANTVSTIVARDGSGNFSAGTITASLTGTASNVTTNANLTGHVTSVGNAAVLGSFTSANLSSALTDETGSGSAVFATSPTLVTPVLGAATATSIVVSSGSTFTNGPILVGAATSTGTASQRLQVTGGAYVSGNLGIGTTNPTEKLTVSNNISLGSAVSGGTATPSYIFLGNNFSNNATRDSLKIQLYNDGSTGKYGFTVGSSGDIQHHSQGTHDFYINNTFSTRISSNANLLIGAGTETGTASQRLQVSGGAYVSGNLGIGTTNPTSKLHVVGDVRVSGVVTATTFVGALTGTATSTTNIPNLTGAITSNNTTTSLGSFTSAQLATALTDETGSGSAVFATSPTLVTPVLGAATATSIVVSSGSTFTNGPILVGAATSTGTASQRLQVTGGAYVSGNLGIGTTNPTVSLQLSPNASISNLNSTTNFGTTAGAAATVTQFLHSNGNSSILRIKATRNTAGADWFTASTKLVQVIDVTEMGYIEYNPNGANYGMAFGQGGSEWARFLSGGNLGIGTTTPTSKLHVVGDVRVSGVVTATDFNSTSDISLKDNIQTIINPLDKIIKLNGVTFNWKENQKPSIGVIAQELEKVLPELVTQGDIKSVNYNGLIGVLIEAVKEQQKQIDELKANQ